MYSNVNMMWTKVDQRMRKYKQKVANSRGWSSVERGKASALPVLASLGQTVV